jgi:mannose-6-phosphate isomerase-like protein (cupin superfamily)
MIFILHEFSKVHSSISSIIIMKGTTKVKPEPKLINAGTGAQEYVRLLGGPPESVTMRSGAVTLPPGKSVGKHTTENNEELLVILDGSGTFKLNDGRQLDMTTNHVLYCPPFTEHDVKNTGAAPLRYIYVVAKAAGET